MKKYFILFFLLNLFCKEEAKTEISFYFWKTKFQLTSFEQESLQNFRTKKLYIRFFDVDKINDLILPISEISDLKNFPKEIEMIPVIFIKNKIWYDLEKNEIDDLVEKIFKKILSMKLENKISEIQFDSDWSLETKESYFYFLEKIKLKNLNLKITATIRLHQIKYYLKTGIPPIGKGYLMFYNFGKLGEKENSIYISQDAKKYLSYIKNYPLELEPILPIFSWLIHKRGNRILNIFSKYQKLIDSENLEKKGNEWMVKKSFIYNETYYKQNDVLQLEEINSLDLKEASLILKKNWKNKNSKIIFFDLNESHLKRITNEQIIKTANYFY